MKRMLCLAAVALVAGAYAMDNSKWDAQQECTYRIMSTLTGGEQYDLYHNLYELPGSFEETYFRAINHASDKNGAMYTTVAVRPGSGDVTAGTENQTINGMDYYAVSYWDRCKKDVTDWDAYQMLVNGVNSNERGVIEETWPNLTEGCQHAILKVIKRSWCIGAPNADQVNWWH